MIHLGLEGSSPECTENVAVISRERWSEIYAPDGTKREGVTDAAVRAYEAEYAERLGRAIRERVGRPWEAIVCSTWGGPHEVATRGLQQFVVESGIGYRRTWAKYRVFVNYAWMHFHLGLEKRVEGNRWYDVVIPNAVDPEMFDFRPQDKQDYFVFLGRLNDDKGVQIAVDLARRVGRPLKLVGPGNAGRFLKNQPHVEHVPPVGVEARRKLLAEAAALVCPTQYVEPLGNVALEAQISGTPVISTDWGGFPETVLHGITGYRCRTMEQFVWAARHVDRIDPHVCRQWVLENFAPDRIARKFDEYFRMLLDLNRGGWYAERPERSELDWLRPAFPESVRRVGGVSGATPG